jgi:Uma2 family endonuclease
VTTPTEVPPTFLPYVRGFTLAEYQKLIGIGFFDEDEPVELLEGYLVISPPATAQHDFAVTVLNHLFIRMLPDVPVIRSKMSVELPESQPEPDVAIARGHERAFDARHPQPNEIALVVEVSDSGLQRDRVDKGRIYARVSIPQYWVVNLVDRQIEVYTDPTGPVSAPVYRRRQDYPAGTTVPVELDGNAVGSVSVDEVLP